MTASPARMMLAVLALALAAAAASAGEIKPAVVFDIGGKFDKSFNEGVHNGAERFKAETKVGYTEFEIHRTLPFRAMLTQVIRAAQFHRSQHCQNGLGTQFLVACRMAAGTGSRSLTLIRRIVLQQFSQRGSPGLMHC